MAASYLTIEERREIERMLKEGYHYRGIASVLSRSNSGIYYEIKKNKTPYNAEKAHKRAESLGFHIRKTSPTSTPIAKRVKNIEMQLEIIFEILKDIKNGKN